MMLADLVWAGIAYGSAFSLRVYLPFPLTADFLPASRFTEVVHPLLLLLGTQVALLYFFGLYDQPTLHRRVRLATRVATALGIQLLATAAWYFFRGEFVLPALGAGRLLAVQYPGRYRRAAVDESSPRTLQPGAGPADRSGPGCADVSLQPDRPPPVSRPQCRRRNRVGGIRLSDTGRGGCTVAGQDRTVCPRSLNRLRLMR